MVLRISWKNVFRSRRRSTLNVVALAVGFTVMLVGLAWVEGYHAHVYTALRDFETGEAQVLHEDYRNQAGRLPLDLTIPEADGLAAALRGRSEIAEVAARIDFSATIGTRRAQLRLVSRGVEPARERRVTVLADYIQEGDYLTEGAAAMEVLLGRPVADRLGLSVGDTLSFQAVDRHGAVNLTDARLAGIFFFGYPPVDDTIVFTTRTAAADFLRLGSAVSRLVLSAAEDASPEAALEAAREVLASSTGPSPGLAAYSWRAFVEAAVTAIETDVFFFRLTLGVLFFLILVGIVNSMSMSILERTGEIGTLRAIGMRRGTVLRLLLAEGAALGLIGIAVGVVLCLPILLYLGRVGIDVAAALPEGMPVPFGARFTSVFTVTDGALALGVTAAAAVLGSLPASVGILRRSIVETMAGERT